VRERLAGHAQRDSAPLAGQDGQRGHDADGRAGAEFGQYQAAIDRWQRVTGRPAPEPTETGARGARVLSPRFVEWLMGLPAGHVTDTEGLTRNAQLKLLGNGVVPQQAEHALRALRELLALIAWVAGRTAE
jgi:DNA (cytosine-5)-methyltransferase 1